MFRGPRSVPHLQSSRATRRIRHQPATSSPTLPSSPVSMNLHVFSHPWLGRSRPGASLQVCTTLGDSKSTGSGCQFDPGLCAPIQAASARSLCVGSLLCNVPREAKVRSPWKHCSGLCSLQWTARLGDVVYVYVCICTGWFLWSGSCA